MSRHSFYGLLFVVLSATSFGTLGLFTRLSYASGLDVTSTLAWRFTIASFFLWSWLLFKGRCELTLKKRVAAFLMGALGYTVQSALFFLAIFKLNSGLANLLLYTYPAMVTLQGSFLAKKLPSSRHFIALFVTGAGCVLTLKPTSGVLDILGIACGLGAAAWYSVYLNIGERLIKGLDPLAVSSFVCLGAAVAFNGAAILFGSGIQIPVGVGGWGAILGVATLGTVIPVAALFEGIKRIGATEASILSTLEPVVTVSLGFFLLNELLSIYQLSGMVLILGSIIWIQIPNVWFTRLLSFGRTSEQSISIGGVK